MMMSDQPDAIPVLDFVWLGLHGGALHQHGFPECGYCKHSPV